MLKDVENNFIRMSERPNRHLLIMGQSGSGKTYFVNRKIEEEVEKGNKVIIFDYSGSFTLKELEKAHVSYGNKMVCRNPVEQEVVWKCPVERYISVLANALVKSLGVGSYYQRKLLKEAISRLGKGRSFSIDVLMEVLELMLKEKEETEEITNIGHLLTRLAPYEEVTGIKVESGMRDEEEESVEIIQVSDYGEQERKFVVEFLSELFWQEVRQGKKRADVVVFDEFQFLSVKSGSALAGMLREGRKFSLAVYMSSQFFGNYSKEEIEVLMQAGNILFFKPVPKERKQIARYIESQNYRNWEQIIDGLKVGEAVLKGNYRLNDKQSELAVPVKCVVEE